MRSECGGGSEGFWWEWEEAGLIFGSRGHLPPVDPLQEELRGGGAEGEELTEEEEPLAAG
jgi:hypothetical protein